MTLKLNVGIRLDGKQRAVGDIIEVSEKVAQRWTTAGIAEKVKPEPAQSTGGDDISTPDTPQSEKRTSTSAKK